MNSAKSLGAAALNKITPECVNVGQAIKLSLIMVVIALILLIAAIIYNYVKKTDTTDADVQKENEEKKTKVVGALSITGTVLVFFCEHYFYSTLCEHTFSLSGACFTFHTV